MDLCFLQRCYFGNYWATNTYTEYFIFLWISIADVITRIQNTDLIFQILSVLYFGSALAFTLSKDILLLIMKSREYVYLIASFYIISFLFWVIAISGLCVLWKMSRKIRIVRWIEVYFFCPLKYLLLSFYLFFQHAGLTLILGIVTAFLVVLQSSTQKNIEANVETQLLSSISFSAEDYANEGWDYFHNMVKFECSLFT